MAIIAKDAGRTFTNHPPGQFRFVCADVYDEGERQGPFGMKHDIRLVFISEAIHVVPATSTTPEERRPFEHSEWYRLSLNEKANLRKFLESWRGLPFTEQQIREGWDVSRVIGANAYVQIVHKPKKDGSGVRAVIASIMRLPQGMVKLEIPKDFEPITARVAKKAAAAAPAASQPGAPPPHEDFDDFDHDGDADDDDGLPF